MIGARALILCLLVGLSPALRADEDARATSKALKDQANAALERGETETARQLLTRAYEVFPSPNLKFNLGVVLLKLHDEAGAADAFSIFVAEVPDAPPQALDYARGQLERLKGTLGRVNVLTDVEGAQLWVEGKPYSGLPRSTPVWLQPGKRRVELRASGKLPVSQIVNISAGEQQSLRMPLAVAEERPLRNDALRTDGAVRKPKDATPLVKKGWFWGAIVGGAAAVALAVSLGVVYGTPPREPSPSLGKVNAN